MQYDKQVLDYDSMIFVANATPTDIQDVNGK